MSLTTSLLKKADDLATKVAMKVSCERPYQMAKKTLVLVRNRAGLMRLIVTGQAPLLSDMKDNWFPTKRQMLAAHKTLWTDMQVLRHRLDAVASRLGSSEVHRARVVRSATNGAAVQVDADMPIGESR